MSQGDEIISVGIDIGTTTTHLIVTRLSFANNQLVNAAPNLAIHQREILHESKIYFTPLNKDGEIDADKAARIIEAAYKEAGISPATIQTGALIITGQSAAARNAQAVSKSLAALSGGFVVESAGPHLESVLAARGSGALEYSKESGKTILNIDIGGGTSNFALIVAGKIVDTACLNIGARMVQFDDDMIKTISDSAALLIEEDLPLNSLLKKIVVGAEAKADVSALEVMATLMAGHILQVAAGEQLPGALSQLMLTENFRGDYSFNQIDQLFFSGGVAAAFFDKDLMHYRDMGVFLARALQAQMVNKSIDFAISPRSIRATVIGAGLHTLQLSGSTIGFDQTILPLRNLKMIKIKCPKNDLDNQKLFGEDLENIIGQELKQRELDWKDEAIALVLSGITKDMLSFRFLKFLADQLSLCFLLYKGREPLVIVSEVDLAMALALLLRGLLPDKRIITVDGINAEEGDYIDIGQPVYSSNDSNTQSLPIVVKTLVFYKSIV